MNTIYYSGSGQEYLYRFVELARKEVGVTKVIFNKFLTLLYFYYDPTTRATKVYYFIIKLIYLGNIIV
jgi:hypothetical protein